MFTKTFNFFRLQGAVVIIFLTALILAAQSSSVSKITWKTLGDKNNEFVLAMPSGIEYFDDGQFTLANKSNTAFIKSRKTIVRYINGAVLKLDIYEGKSKDIQSLITDNSKIKLVGEKTANGFQIKSYSYQSPDIVWEQQHFFDSDSLYVMSAFYRSERTNIVDNFFKSVRLFQNGKGIAPNFPNTATKAEILAPLPDISEETFSDNIEEQPDSPAIFIYLPRPSRVTEFGRSNTGIVKFKVLLSAAGKVLKVKTVFSPTVGMADGVRPAVEHMVGLPALKDGKPVSTWQLFGYGFLASNTGF